MARAPARFAPSLADRIDGWEHSRIGPIRQYVRLLSSLVIFSSEELFPSRRADDDDYADRP